MNHKVVDTRKIVDYITSFRSAVLVEDILQHSGADKRYAVQI